MIRVAGAVLAVLLLFACEKKSGNEVRMVNPNELLFSLPTLCNALPATVPGQVPPGTFTMPEDDWRQIEFVAVADRPSIEKQLAELHDFKAKHRKGIGWDDVYVRHDRQAALAPNDIPWSKVTAIIGEMSAPLAIDRGKAALVAGGFSKQIAPGILLYGQNSAGKLASLGVEVNGADFNAAKPLLQRIADTLRLDLVDWYGGSVIVASRKRMLELTKIRLLKLRLGSIFEIPDREAWQRASFEREKQ